MVTCIICKKSFKNTQGLRGHNTFVHGQTTSDSITQVAGLATEPQYSDARHISPSDTQQQLVELENRLSKLEHITGVGEQGVQDEQNDVGQKPTMEQIAECTGQVNQFSEQLIELYQQVSKLSEALEIADTLSRERLGKFTEQVESLDALQKGVHGELMAIVNNHSVQLKKTIEAFNSKLAADESKLLEINKRLDKVEAQQIKDQDRVIKSFEQVIGSLKAEIDDIKLRMLRKPTDDVVSVSLTDGRDHKFKEYKGPQGLRRPYKTATDLFLGDKFVDLSEPED